MILIKNYLKNPFYDNLITGDFSILKLFLIECGDIQDQEVSIKINKNRMYLYIDWTCSKQKKSS